MVRAHDCGHFMSDITAARFLQIRRLQCCQSACGHIMHLCCTCLAEQPAAGLSVCIWFLCPARPVRNTSGYQT